MASTATRRKPRRVARQEEDDDVENDGEPIVRRPNLSGAKPKTKLRMSFAPEEIPDTSSYDEQEASSGPPSRIRESKKNKKSSLHATVTESLPFRAGNQELRPSYSHDYLAELRTSTPSKPRSPAESDDNSADQSIADQTSTIQKFDSGISNTLVPSAAEIAEKKERRARLAKEEDYIALDDEEQDWRITLDKAEKDTRLVREDEDFAEGFEEFVDDGTVALGKKAERDKAKKDRAHMQDLIDNAEQSSEDESEAERNFAYEDAQTRAGMDGMTRETHERSSADKMPPTVTKIPRLGTVIERLRAQLHEMEQKGNLIAKQRQGLLQEKTEVEAREKEIQALVTEAGEKYEKARLEAGLVNEIPTSNAVISAAQTPDAMVESSCNILFH